MGFLSGFSKVGFAENYSLSFFKKCYNIYLGIAHVKVDIFGIQKIWFLRTTYLICTMWPLPLIPHVHLHVPLFKSIAILFDNLIDRKNIFSMLCWQNNVTKIGISIITLVKFRAHRKLKYNLFSNFVQILRANIYYSYINYTRFPYTKLIFCYWCQSPFFSVNCIIL